MRQSLSLAGLRERDRWAGWPAGRAGVVSAVPDVAGQQPAPGGRADVVALIDRGDTALLVDVGTGDFGGDHDSFTRLYRTVGAGGSDT